MTLNFRSKLIKWLCATHSEIAPQNKYTFWLSLWMRTKRAAAAAATVVQPWCIRIIRIIFGGRWIIFQHCVCLSSVSIWILRWIFRQFVAMHSEHHFAFEYSFFFLLLFSPFFSVALSNAYRSENRMCKRRQNPLFNVLMVCARICNA